MNKKEYIEKINSSDLNQISKNLLLKQVENFYELENNYKQKKHKYKVWGEVKLKKWTLLHWTYKNFEWLEQIAKDGLVTWQFSTWRSGKYLYTVWVWNLKKAYLLKNYINFYSGWTIKYGDMWYKKNTTKVIPYDEMWNVMNFVEKSWYQRWFIDQTKEARFMPSITQNIIQIWIIFDWNIAGKLLSWDILDYKKISDSDVKEFINEWYYKDFLKERLNKDDFFTNRESAILFWIPAVCIQGILVWRKYEKNKKILEKIKKLLPNAYICNLDGKVIYT